MSKIVTVPILPHLKKFILIHHRAEEPVPVDMRSVLGQFTYSILISNKETQKSNERHEQTLALEFPQDIYQLELRFSKLVRLNTYYDKYFKDMMVSWIIAQDNLGVPAYQSVQRFLEFYDITETEYPVTTAYRHWERYKNGEYIRDRKNRKSVLL